MENALKYAPRLIESSRSPVGANFIDEGMMILRVVIMREAYISRTPIERYKLRKFGRLAARGGEGNVLMNRVIEPWKRKKMMSGNTIELGLEGIHVQYDGVDNHE